MVLLTRRRRSGFCFHSNSVGGGGTPEERRRPGIKLHSGWEEKFRAPEKKKLTASVSPTYVRCLTRAFQIARFSCIYS